MKYMLVEVTYTYVHEPPEKTNVINNVKTMHRKVYVIFCLSNYGFVKTPTFAFIRCIVFGMLCKAKYSSTAFRCPAQW